MPPATAPDLLLGAFSDDPPWVLDLDALRWRTGLDRVRARTRGEVPELTRPRRVPPLGRLAVVARDLGVPLAAWAATDRRRDRSTSRRGLSRRLRRAAERLGPTYIKLGQIISAGEGVFPEELVAEFKLCRDRVAPESFADVRRVVEEDLGRPLEEVFTAFDRRPLAAASIAQVHAATLRTGEDVVVKVQRPQVAALVRRDLRVMSWLAPFLVGRIPVTALANPPALVELFADTITEELDFRLEADNMLDQARTLAALDQRLFVVPRPHPELVTRRVLVMERLSGFAFDDVAGMRAAGVDTEAVVRGAMVAFLEGALLHGVFHGDLHGGNLFIRPDGRVALLDHGITGRLDEPRRLAFLRLLLGGVINDVKGQLAALVQLGALPPDTDLDDVVRELQLDQPPPDPTSLSADELVSQLKDVVKRLLGLGARMPKELMLFVKDMVFLDQAIATLAPGLDIFGEVAQIAAYFTTTHGSQLARDVGVDPAGVEVDVEAMRVGMGVAPGTPTLTYEDVRERRALIQRRLAERGAVKEPRGRRIGRALTRPWRGPA